MTIITPGKQKRDLSFGNRAHKYECFVQIIYTHVSGSLLPIDLFSSTVCNLCIEQKSGLFDLALLSCAIASPDSIQWSMNYFDNII